MTFSLILHVKMFDIEAVHVCSIISTGYIFERNEKKQQQQQQRNHTQRDKEMLKTMLVVDE